MTKEWPLPSRSLQLIGEIFLQEITYHRAEPVTDWSLGSGRVRGYRKPGFCPISGLLATGTVAGCLL